MNCLTRAQVKVTRTGRPYEAQVHPRSKRIRKPGLQKSVGQESEPAAPEKEKSRAPLTFLVHTGVSFAKQDPRFKSWFRVRTLTPQQVEDVSKQIPAGNQRHAFLLFLDPKTTPLSLKYEVGTLLLYTWDPRYAPLEPPLLPEVPSGLQDLFSI